MLQAGSMRGGRNAGPRMMLDFECVIFRPVTTVSPIGTEALHYMPLGNSASIPCDVAPISDELSFSQGGGEEAKIDHIIHFEAGTDVQLRDGISITRSPSGFGYIGAGFQVMEVLEPSETLRYKRCRVVSGKTYAG